MTINHYAPSEFSPRLDNVAKLLWVMEQLRDPEHGCPWDKQQTFESIVPFTIEEAYEVADAIEHGTMQDVQEELGDLLFQVVFYAQFGKEDKLFEFDDVAKLMVEKLIRRHPHVFTQLEVKSTEVVKENWEQIKRQERQVKAAQQGKADDTSILANIPAGMAPLTKAQKIQKRCAKVGFDWPNIEPVAEKVSEELHEVMQELQQETIQQEALAEEIGDLLFAVVNLARHVNVDAETALRKANHKFEQRFRGVEQKLQAKPLAEFSLQEMEQAWQAVKQEECE